MTDKEKQIVDKLKRLINNTPYEGERNTALNVLKKYCLAHGITEEDLDSQEEANFSYDLYDQNSYNIFQCVCFHFFNRRKRISHRNELDKFVSYFEYRHKRNSIFVEIKCSPSEFAALIGEFEVYKSSFNKQLKKRIAELKERYLRAYLDKNDLLLPPDTEYLIGKEEPYSHQKFVEDLEYELLVKKTKKAEVYKQLENR